MPMVGWSAPDGAADTVGVAQNFARRTGEGNQAFLHTVLAGHVRQPHGIHAIALYVNEGALVIPLAHALTHAFEPAADFGKLIFRHQRHGRQAQGGP